MTKEEMLKMSPIDERINSLPFSKEGDVEIACEILKETEKALLLKGYAGIKAWIPKSQCRKKVYADYLWPILAIPKWLAAKNSILPRQ